MKKNSLANTDPEIDVLVVCNYNCNCDLVKILQQAGYKTKFDTDRGVILQSVKTGLPKLVIIDAELSDDEGFEVLRLLKTGVETKALPVILVSESEDTFLKIKSFDVVDVINKPLHTEEVVARIKLHIELRKMQLDLEKQNIQLKKNEEKYRLIAENMGNCISVLNMDFEYVYVAPNIEKTFGIPVDEYIKKGLRETMTPESFTRVMKIFEEEMALEVMGTAAPDRSRVIELEEYCSDGSTIWMENVVSFIRDESGTLVKILAVSRDITEKKLAAEEKAKLTEQLYHAQKMESVGTLAGGVAHDFNNLLQVIGGYIGILLSIPGRNQKDIERLKTIEKAADRASELVSNLLAFSRKNISIKKDIDFNTEIRSAVNILERTIPKMVKITMELDDSIPEIFADPANIEQIILNLGKNASDAMPDGGTLSIKTEFLKYPDGFQCECGELKEGSHIVLTVSDTGLGMDKETKDHVFDPFFTTKRVGKGTGLGLASVYGIVHSHGGHVHCESEQGAGTVFTAYFPASASVMYIEKAITEKAEKLEGNETVLVVDDEENIRDFYAAALKEFGYSVLTAERGEEALSVFKESGQKIDIVIMDLNMPGMGGHKCMVEMKKIDPASKIIVASGYSEIFQTTEDIIKSGASGFIRKPFKLKTVLEKIRETLDEEKIIGV